MIVVSVTHTLEDANGNMVAVAVRMDDHGMFFAQLHLNNSQDYTQSMNAGNRQKCNGVAWGMLFDWINHSTSGHFQGSKERNTAIESLNYIREHLQMLGEQS